MRNQFELQKYFSAACQKANIFANVYVGTAYSLKPDIKKIITSQLGLAYVKNAEYVVFYVIKNAFTPEIQKRILNAVNSLNVSPAFKLEDVIELEVETGLENTSHAVMKLTAEQVDSLPFISGKDNVNPPENTLPNTAEEGDPLEAIAYADENDLGVNDTIINIFTPAEKEKLSKMIKHGEFNQQESAVLRALMSELLKLEDLAVMLGAKSKRTQGQPMSKIAARKELNRILDVVAQRSQAKIGRRLDLNKIAEYRQQMRQNEVLRRKQARENKKREREARKEFFELLKELNATQREYGLPVSRYNKIWQQNTQSLDAIKDVRGDHFEV